MRINPIIVGGDTTRALRQKLEAEMGFTKALYYPTIDIRDEDWLRTAILFWDEINTIVPSSIDSPYQNNSTQYLSDQGILRPIRVNPDSEFIEELTMDTINYLDSSEGYQLLTQGKNIQDDVDEIFRIHREKLPYLIRNKLENVLTHNNGWIQVNTNFAIFYMTLLANKVCEKKSIALLSDNSLIANLTDKVRLDNQFPISARDFRYWSMDSTTNDQKRIYLAQGLLTNLIIDGVKLSGTTTLEDIVNFKKQHRDELGLFRTTVASLTQSVSRDATYEAMRQQVEDIYKDEFLPAYNNFKKALTGSGIKWVSENFMKLSLISTGATGLPMALLGLSLPHALLAGAGISLIASIVSYNEDKKEKLRANPYSYLLATGRPI